jgi:pyruvate dehydrogenase E1 component alpha subunit
MFLEAITYRWYGHVDWREDIDVGVNRSAEELLAWRKRDPIARLSKALLSDSLCSAQTIDQIYEACRVRVDSAWKQALKDPYPTIDSLLERVYK